MKLLDTNQTTEFSSLRFLITTPNSTSLTFDFPFIKTQPTTFLSTLQRGGVPPHLRPSLWYEVAGVQDAQIMFGMAYYSSLLTQMECRDDPNLKQIQLDITRTFPGHRVIDTPEGQKMLQNVLFAYSVHNPLIGYVQSMNYIAALILSVMQNEENSFWVFAYIMDLFQSFHTASLQGVRIGHRMLEDIIQRLLPNLWQHIIEIDVELQLVTYPWFLCFMAQSMAAEIVVRLWFVILASFFLFLFFFFFFFFFFPSYFPLSF
jgi:hypothetical protein